MQKENVPFVLRWKLEYIFLFNCKMYNEFMRDILGIGPRGERESNADGVVFLQEMFKTLPRKLARNNENVYDLGSSCIEK